MAPVLNRQSIVDPKKVVHKRETEFEDPRKKNCPASRSKLACANEVTFLEVQLRGSGFAPEIRQNIIFLPKTVLKKRACAAVRRFALIEIGWKVSQVQRRLGTEKKSTGLACWKSNIILSQQPDIMKTLKIKSRPSSATSLFGHYLAEGVSLLSICAKKDPLRARYQKKKPVSTR